MSSGHYCDTCGLTYFNCICQPSSVRTKSKSALSIMKGWSEAIDRLAKTSREIKVVPSLDNLGPDLSGMPEKYPKQEPLKYGWNCVNKFKPPSGKLQFYTIGGTCILGEYSTLAPGFATHWSYLLPSPSKQEGKIK